MSHIRPPALLRRQCYSPGSIPCVEPLCSRPLACTQIARNPPLFPMAASRPQQACWQSRRALATGSRAPVCKHTLAMPVAREACRVNISRFGFRIRRPLYTGLVRFSKVLSVQHPFPSFDGDLVDNRFRQQSHVRFGKHSFVSVFVATSFFNLAQSFFPPCAISTSIKQPLHTLYYRQPTHSFYLNILFHGAGTSTISGVLSNNAAPSLNHPGPAGASRAARVRASPGRVPHRRAHLV